MPTLTHLQPYSQNVQYLTGDPASSGWVIRSGAFPLGLTMTSAGLVSGTPNTLGESTVTVSTSVASPTLYPITYTVAAAAAAEAPPSGSPEAMAVARFLGRGDRQDVVDLAAEHLPIVTAFVRAYTRDKGFTGDEPAADLRAVITTATARLVVNPEQSARVQSIDYAESPAVLNGFTLPELAVLHRYRRRAL